MLLAKMLFITYNTGLRGKERASGISGMISRDLIGPPRFDETLPHGEDTIFKYILFRRQVHTAYSSQQWYYYRTKPDGFSHRAMAMLGDVYSEKTIRIRDHEYQKGNITYAMIRETELSTQLRQRYESCRKSVCEDQCRQIKASAFRECGHPLFRSIDPFHKGLFYLCFKCYPLYVPVSWAAAVV